MKYAKRHSHIRCADDSDSYIRVESMSSSTLDGFSYVCLLLHRTIYPVTGEHQWVYVNHVVENSPRRPRVNGGNELEFGEKMPRPN